MCVILWKISIIYFEILTKIQNIIPQHLITFKGSSILVLTPTGHSSTFSGHNYCLDFTIFNSVHLAILYCVDFDFEQMFILTFLLAK